MHIFAVAPSSDSRHVPGQIVFALANGTTYPRENFPVDATIVSRALVQLPGETGLIVFADDGNAWPFCHAMAQRIVDAFAPRHMHTDDMSRLPLRDQAGLFEFSLQRAMETEPLLPVIFASAKFAH